MQTGVLRIVNDSDGQQSEYATGMNPLRRFDSDDPVNRPNVGEAAGEFAHEFNNLLTVILNYAGLIAGELEAMERGATDPRVAAMREDLKELELATLRAARLIRDLVAVSRQASRRPSGD
jgi:signal transduction histidine kinase